MAKKKINVLTEMTTAQLKRLLAARERIDVLEAGRAKLLKELAGIEKELAKLIAGAPLRGRPAGRKPGPKKKAAVKKKTTKKTTKKAAKRVVRKKVVRKTTRKKTVRSKAPAGGRVSLEDVILAVLKKSDGSMSFKEIYAAIVDGKLYKSKAARFDNVLRRTLSTSKKVKRVGRGIYAAA